MGRIGKMRDYPPSTTAFITDLSLSAKWAGQPAMSAGKGRCPGGTNVNSSAFQRWVGPARQPSPEGTAEGRRQPNCHLFVTLPLFSARRSRVSFPFEGITCSTLFYLRYWPAGR